jgi:type IV pilus assembly protein PilA
MNAMIAKRMALKGKETKGFTLVEIIVVLVILAILMAIAVPALTGYIDKAKNVGASVEAKTVLTAVQAVETENSGKYGKDTAAPFYAKNSAGTVMSLDDIAKAAGVLVGDTAIDGTGTDNKTVTALTFDANGKILTLVYKTSSGQVATLQTDGSFTVS